ncbi:predicted protein [Postia placenta Mad-698-R]|nr:predicted protein [Postia placenta Mad-698-R]
MYLDLNLNETLGPALIGTIFAIMLFGLSCAQVMYYVCEYPKDKLLLKGLVTILWCVDQISSSAIASTSCRLLDAGATIVDTVIVWHYTVTFRNNVIDLAKLSIIISTQSGPDMAILQTLGAVLADICTTTSLILILNGQKTGIKATDRLVQKLTIYAVNRGGLITPHNSLRVKYIALQKNSLYWVIFHLPGSKMTGFLVMSRSKMITTNNDGPALRDANALSWLLDTAAAVVDAMTKNDIIRLVEVFRGTLRQSEYALAVGDFQLDGHTNLTAERFGQAPTIFIVQCYYIYTIWIPRIKYWLSAPTNGP